MRDGGEAPGIRVAEVARRIGEVLLAPSEHGLLIVGGPTDRHEPLTEDELRVGDLGVGASVRAVAEGGERVSAIRGVEVVAGGDAVLGAVRRRAVAPRKRVVFEVVIAHQGHHGGHIAHAGVVAREYEGPRGPVVAEPVAVLGYQLWTTGQVEHVRVGRDVVTGPVRLI